MGLGFVFDLDGVLFNSQPLHRKAWRGLLQELGCVVSEEELNFILDGPKREEILRHFLGFVSREQTAAYLERKDGIFRSEEESVKPLDGVEAFLDMVEAAAIPKVVATSASESRARRMLQKHNLASRFTAVITGEDVPTGKSSPAIFVRSAELLGLATSDVLVFEDAIPAVRGATSIGMKCIGVAAADDRRAQLRDAGAVFVLSDFMNLNVADVLRLFG